MLISLLLLFFIFCSGLLFSLLNLFIQTVFFNRYFFAIIVITVVLSVTGIISIPYLITELVLI